jgi:uncharacterized membrane protein
MTYAQGGGTVPLVDHRDPSEASMPTHERAYSESPSLDQPQKPSQYNRPRTLDELTDRNVCALAELEKAAKGSAGVGERLAVRVAAFCGTIGFVWFHVVWFGAWIFSNTSSLFANHPDPFPFTFLTLVVSLEAIFLSAFILISQNQETRVAERRSHLDLQINLLTEQENTNMLLILKSIAAKVGAGIAEVPDVDVLERPTRPERLLDQIDKATEQSEKGREV